MDQWDQAWIDLDHRWGDLLIEIGIERILAGLSEWIVISRYQVQCCHRAHQEGVLIESGSEI